MEKLLKKRTAFRELSSIIVFIVSKKRNAAIRAIGNPITNSNTLTRGCGRSKMFYQWRGRVTPLSTNFRLNSYWKRKKKWRGERYRARVERKTTTVPTEPWLCSQLLLPPPPVTLRILLYLPVCHHLPLPRDVRGGRESRTYRIYFIKPFSELLSSRESSALECKIIIFQTHYTRCADAIFLLKIFFF